ncbi:MAG TPA: hypothetical protein ENF87_01055 [Thermoproteales archaeon]|nr:hypothetical protein [Thermoproteales archaeon]
MELRKNNTGKYDSFKPEIKDYLIKKPTISVADKYYGIVRVKKWSEDLDEFLVEAIKKLWKSSM